MGGGLFSIIQNGTRSLFAAQLGMDVAGQNIANADVDGYSRKRLNMTADYRYDGTFGQMGFGIDVINVERMRDSLIDQQIQRQNQQVGYYEEIDHSLEQIENIFTEPGDTGLLSYVDKFFDSWHNLADNPADLSARTMVKTSAQILTDTLHNVSSELSALKEHCNEKITNDALRVNEIAKELYNLNLEIGVVEVGEQNANDSRDRRDLLLKELAKLIDIDTIENDQGQMTVTTAGQMLVSPSGFRSIEPYGRTINLPDGTQETSLSLRFADSKKDYMPLSGEMKAIFDCRDTIIPEYQANLDILAQTLVATINAQHEKGYNLFGYTGIDFFEPGVTGASDIALSASILADVQNIAAASAGEANPATPNVFLPGQLDFGNPATLLSKTNSLPPTGTDIARNTIKNSVTVTALVAGVPTTLRENIDYHIDYVNGTIQMLHAGYNGTQVTVGFQYRTGGYQGAGDNSNAVLIAQLRHQLTMEPDPLGNPTNTFAQYYGAFIGKLGLNRDEARSNLETRNFLVQQYETSQDSMAGVSLDEEMADIIKFQHTYQAAARMISTSSQMLDILMNM
jgi:flagellar hook-associated protein 1 FlgK